MIDIFTRFPHYCESYQHLWLNEPLNIISNLSFFVGAYYLYKLARNKKYNKNVSIFLTGIMVILGLGSLAWHSHRTTLTLLSDELPIYIFIIFAFYFLIQSLTKKHTLTVTTLFFTILVYYLLFAYIPVLNLFQGSLHYVFALCIFFVINTLIIHKFGSSYSFTFPLSILVIALIFRMIDISLCPIFPIGTHFLWHILVATGIYLSSHTILHLDQKRTVQQ